MDQKFNSALSIEQRQVKGFWLRHALAILSKFLHQPVSNKLSLAKVANGYIRNHKEMGKKDRQGSLEIVYFIIKNFLSLQKKTEFLPPVYLQEFSLAHLLMAFYLFKFFPQRLNETYPSKAELKAAYQKYQAFLKQQNIVKRISLRYSFDESLLKALLPSGSNQSDIKKIIRLLKSLRQKSILYIRPNLQKNSSQELLLHLKKQNIECRQVNINEQSSALQIIDRINFFSLPAFQKGWFEVQDLGSQLISLLIKGLLDTSQSKQLLIDACAGAGGKTLHLADIFHETAQIVAFDNDKNRLQKIFPRIKRNQYNNIKAFDQDSHSFCQTYQNKADVVLIDAPCSGSGICRRHPENGWRFSTQQIIEFAVLQKQVLQAYSQLVKKGGYLVYVTCSIWAQENQEVADWFSKEYSKDFCIIHAPKILKKQNIIVQEKSAYLYLLPHEFHCDAFFAAVWKRR